MTLLSVKDLSLKISNTTILKDVDIDVDAGEIVGLIG